MLRSAKSAALFTIASLLVLVALFCTISCKWTAQRKTLQEKVDKLQKEAAVMSEADRLRAEREARDLELNVNRRFNELQEDLNLRRNEEVGRMQRSLLQEVQAYARANGYQLIVSEGVLYAAEGLDITPQVVAAIKAKAPAAATPPKP